MIGIVILNYNSSKDVIECIKSIKQFTSIKYHIYVVDNASTKGSVTYLSDCLNNWKDVTLIFNSSNAGYSAGNNIGIKRAINDHCSVIFVVNPDVVLLNDALTIMTNDLLSDNRYMMIGPSICNSFNEEAQIPRSKITLKSFVLDRKPFNRFAVFNRLSNRLYKPSDRVFSFSGSVSGCCFGIRADDYLCINYLDENVFLYYEEEILAYKMDKINRLSVFDSNAKVFHKEGITTSKEGNAFVQFHRWNSSLYVLTHHAHISFIVSFIIAIWNIAYWLILSINSKNYRLLCKEFIKSNSAIVFKRRM